MGRHTLPDGTVIETSDSLLELVTAHPDFQAPSPEVSAPQFVPITGSFHFRGVKTPGWKEPRAERSGYGNPVDSPEFKALWSPKP